MKLHGNIHKSEVDASNPIVSTSDYSLPFTVDLKKTVITQNDKIVGTVYNIYENMADYQEYKIDILLFINRIAKSDTKLLIFTIDTSNDNILAGLNKSDNIIGTVVKYSKINNIVINDKEKQINSDLVEDNYTDRIKNLVNSIFYKE